MKGTNNLPSNSYVYKRKFIDKESILAYSLIAPSTVIFIALMFYPVISVFIMSLYKTTKLAGLLEFVGFGNFSALFNTKEFWILVARTFIWTVLGVVGHFVFGMIFAILLNKDVVGRKIARMFLIIPWATAIPISAILWRGVFNPEFGLLNYTLKITGIWNNPPIWLATPIPAFFAAMWVDVWIGIPFVALVLLAGMQSISKNLYESAEIDGAAGYQKFMYITIPSIRHIIVIVTLLTALWTFNSFPVIYILTGGGPSGKTDILITATYRNGFEFLHFDIAASLAVVTFVLLSVISIVYARLYFKAEDEG